MPVFGWGGDLIGPLARSNVDTLFHDPFSKRSLGHTNLLQRGRRSRERKSAGFDLNGFIIRIELGSDSWLTADRSVYARHVNPRLGHSWFVAAILDLGTEELREEFRCSDIVSEGHGDIVLVLLDGDVRLELAVANDIGHLRSVLVLQQNDDFVFALARDIGSSNDVSEIASVGNRRLEGHVHIVIGHLTDGDGDRHAVVGRRGERCFETCDGGRGLAGVEVVTEGDDRVLRVGLQTVDGLLDRAGGELGDVLFQGGDDLTVALALDQAVFDDLPVVEVLGRRYDLHVDALVSRVRRGDLLERQLRGLFGQRRGEDLGVLRIRQTAACGGDGLDAQDILGFRIEVAECEGRSRSRVLGLHDEFVARLVLLGEAIFVTFGIGYGIPRHLEAGGRRRGHRDRRFGEHRAALLFYIVAVATTREGE